MTLAARTAPARLAALVLALLGLAFPAVAQFGMGGMDFGGMMQVRRGELKHYAKILKLDADQAAAAEDLRAGFGQACQTLSKDFQAKMEQASEKMQDGTDFRAMQKEMVAAGIEFGQKGKALEKGFFDDLRALLTPDQDAAWPSVERARRRATGMRFGLIAGQNVDLIDVLADIGASEAPGPELADATSRYELEIDKSIQAMEKWQEEQQKQQQDQDFDPAKWQEMMKKAQDMFQEMGRMARGMRDVNRQYARVIEPLLPAEGQLKFNEEFKRRSFPRVYREAWIVKAMNQADKFEDLSSDQRATLAELRESYARESAGANARWAAAIDARDEKTGGQLGAMMAGFSGEGNDPSAQAVTDSRKARRELDDRYKEKLNTLLGDDQRSRLPAEERDRSDQFGWMEGPTNEDEEEPPQR